VKTRFYNLRKICQNRLRKGEVKNGVADDDNDGILITSINNLTVIIVKRLVTANKCHNLKGN
jgi:hypothetical protein